MKKNNKIKIEVNDKLLTVDQTTSLLKYIKKIKMPLKKVALELNHEIIDKRRLVKITLKNYDKIEIVHFIGGG